jgi:hypothetical protein
MSSCASVPGKEADILPPSSTEVKNGRATPPILSVYAWRLAELIRPKDNFVSMCSASNMIEYRSNTVLTMIMPPLASSYFWSWTREICYCAYLKASKPPTHCPNFFPVGRSRGTSFNKIYSLEFHISHALHSHCVPNPCKHECLGFDESYRETCSH